MNVLFVWPNKGSQFFRPISISLLSALLKREGHKTACFDTSFVDFNIATTISSSDTGAKVFKPVDLAGFDVEKRPVDYKKEFFECLESFKPSVIAFTTLSDEIVLSKELADIAKAWNEEAVTVFGGKGTLIDLESVVSLDCVDFVCRGEGIVAFPELVKAIEENRSPTSVKNMCFMLGNKVVKNCVRPLFTDFDSLPYLDWSIFDERLFFKPYEGKLYRGGDHMISCGCPNNCTYCINDYLHCQFGYVVQRYSPKRIVAELEKLTKDYDIGLYKFHDEDFLLKPTEYFQELSGLYSEKVGVPFVCMTNSKTVNEERVRLLKEMGCVSVSLGIETGDRDLRKNVLKRIDSEEDIARGFKLLNDAGIITNSFNMLGIPFETRQTYMETVRVNRLANPKKPQMGFFYPFKKTKLRQIAIENGFYDPEKEKEYEWGAPVLHFNSLSEKELVVMKNRFVLYVKLPKKFWPYIKKSELGDKTGEKLAESLYKIYEETVFAHDGDFNDNNKMDEYLLRLEDVVNYEDWNRLRGQVEA